MVQQKPNRDIHDYIYIYGMLFLTGVIAWSAYYVVPTVIESTALTDWQRIEYTDVLGWMEATFTDTDDIILQCEILSPGTTKILNGTYATCANGKIVHAVIKKDENEECFLKWEDSCG